MTRRVELDYIAPLRRPVWPGLAVLVFSLVVAGGLLERYRDAQQEVMRLETESGLIAPDRMPAKTQSKASLDEEAKNAEMVVRRLTLPWASLVGTLEAAATREVAILQLQPDAEQRLLKLTAEARTRDAMFQYVERLSAAKGLAEVHLVSHQVQFEDPQRPIQFSVQAAMR
jgi:autotransporter translocation and assembly factor TamB